MFQGKLRAPNSKEHTDRVSQLPDVIVSLQDGLGEDLVSGVPFGPRSREKAGPESESDLLVLPRRLPEKTLKRH
jgi:hypothetical protein